MGRSPQVVSTAVGPRSDGTVEREICPSHIQDDAGLGKIAELRWMPWQFVALCIKLEGGPLILDSIGRLGC